MSSAGGRQPSQSRAIPTRTVTLSDAAQLPADYCTTPGGTLFSTTPGGKSAAPAGASGGARPGQPERRVSRADRACRACIPSVCRAYGALSARSPRRTRVGMGLLFSRDVPGARRVPAGRQLDPWTGWREVPGGTRAAGAQCLGPAPARYRGAVTRLSLCGAEGHVVIRGAASIGIPGTG